jgi:hypothetical protein
VAIVDEEMAIDLFNNTNVVGMYLELYGQEFKIIGVTALDMSIVQKMSDSGYGSIYIPVEYMLEYEENSKVTFLETRAAYMGTTGGNINRMKEALASIGKSASNYKITDYNIEKILMVEKAQACIFISGIGIMIMLLRLIKKRVEEVFFTINGALKENYFKDVVKRKYMKLGLVLTEIIVLLMFILVVWNTVKFSFYIPTEYVPDELIDIEFFSELIESLMQNRVQGIGHIPSFVEMKVNGIRILQNWNLSVGVFAGFPLYWIGLRLLKLNHQNIIKHQIFSSIIIALSFILSLFVLNIFNMPMAVNVKGVLIVFSFIFLSASRLEQDLIKKRSDI